MSNSKGYARRCGTAVAIAVLALVGCEEDDAVFGPLEDTVAPAVNIVEVSTDEVGTLTIKAEADDEIAVTQLVIEVRRTDQQVIEITPEGDTLVLGALLFVDTTRFSGRSTDVDEELVLGGFLGLFSEPTGIQVRAIAEDAQENRGFDEVNLIVAGGPGGGLAGPQVSITSPQANQTVRSGTLIRVGVEASDEEAGLASLGVTLSGATSASALVQFSEFRTNIDTLFDFFIPDGATGQLTIAAEAINRNSISGFAQINVDVQQEIANDTLPPTVSMLVSGGTLVRSGEPRRMEVDDSLMIDLVGQDLETAISRMGVTIDVTNVRATGSPSVTLTEDSIFSTSISGTVPLRLGLVPEDPRLAPVFTSTDIPDTLRIELTAWAFDDAAAANCGASVDTTGVPNDLECTSGTPTRAVGVPGGLVQRLIVSGRTIGFPQGSVIADATVDTIRELLMLADFEFGLVRVFDLRNETFADNVPVGAQPWGMTIDNSEDSLMVGNSGGTNISVVALGPQTPGSPAVEGEQNRYQTQDLAVYRVQEAFDAFGNLIFPITDFHYSDRPQFVAQAASGLVLFSTRPAQLNQQPGTIREYSPTEDEIRFFISYAEREPPPNPQIQIVNADSVLAVDGSTKFKVCDHERGNPSNVGCIIATDSLEDAQIQVQDQVTNNGWDTEIFQDLVIESIGLQDTTFVAASGDREFIAFGEGDTPERPGRVIMYESATRTITNSLMVTDLTENAADRIFGLALNNDGSMGVGRGAIAFYFDNVLRLLGTNNDINPTGVGAALHPDHNAGSVSVEDERLSFLGSGDAVIEIVDTHFFDFPRGKILIRDQVIGPLRVTRPLPPDPANVALKLYGVTANGVVVIQVRDSDIDPL